MLKVVVKRERRDLISIFLTVYTSHEGLFLQTNYVSWNQQDEYKISATEPDWWREQLLSHIFCWRVQPHSKEARLLAKKCKKWQQCHNIRRLYPVNTIDGAIPKNFKDLIRSRSALLLVEGWDCTKKIIKKTSTYDRTWLLKQAWRLSQTA